MFEHLTQAVIALIAVPMCWSFAVVLFRAGAPGSVARKLALLLVAEGVAVATTGSIEFLFVNPIDFYAAHPQLGIVETLLHALGDCGMLALYPPFLAAALNTRIARPFGKRSVRMALAIAVFLLYAAFAWPWFMALIQDTEPDYKLTVFPSMTLYVALTAVFVFAFCASLQAWHGSTGAARKRAGMFVVAFGIRDVFWGFIYAMQVSALWRHDYDAAFTENPPFFTVYMLGTFIAVPLIAYGILRTQLFDIDLRIRWTIKQSTLAALVIAIVYVLSEGASRLLSNELGNFAGLLAAAVVVFFLAPLQRLAERVAAVAMPNTHNTPEYAAFRKMQVYEAAVIDALPGGISDKERALLRRLRESLGISDSDALAIEHDLETQHRSRNVADQPAIA